MPTHTLPPRCQRELVLKRRSQHCKTATTRMSSQGSAASAASMPPPGLHTSNRSFFKSYITQVDSNSRQQCSLCRKDWSPTTNIVNMEPHFESNHHQIWKQRPRRESPPSQTIPDAFNKRGLFTTVTETGLETAFCWHLCVHA